MAETRDYDFTPDGRFLVVGLRPWGDPVVLAAAPTRYQAARAARRLRTGGLEGYTKLQIEDSTRRRRQGVAA